MHRRILTRALLALAFATGLAHALPAAAQNWPTKPIRIVNPFPPGGPSDLLLRSIAERMHAALGQPLVIENKPGASGNIGAADVARAAPDGYTWLLGTDTIVTINPQVFARMGFELDELMPVSIATEFAQVLVCNPQLGVKTLAELIAKARSTSLNYASGGAGVPGHMAMELLLTAAGVSMTHVPYKGPALAMQDVIGGQLPCGFLAGPTVLPQVKAGKLVALAISGTKRSPLAPEIPTVAEAGFPGYDATFYLVLYTRRGVPQPIVERFRTAFVEALRAPEVTARMQAIDQQVVGSTPAEAAQRLAATSRQWGDVVRRIGLKLD